MGGGSQNKLFIFQIRKGLLQLLVVVLLNVKIVQLVKIKTSYFGERPYLSKWERLSVFRKRG